MPLKMTRFSLEPTLNTGKLSEAFVYVRANYSSLQSNTTRHPSIELSRTIAICLRRNLRVMFGKSSLPSSNNRAYEPVNAQPTTRLLLGQKLTQSLAAILVLLFPLTFAYAEETQSTLWEMSWKSSLGMTDQGLFSIPVAGEVFSAENATIGHRTSDASLSGNGILGFDLVRKFQDTPQAYLYAFGNNSFDLPTIQFKFAGTQYSPQDMPCDKLKVNTVENLFNDIKFSGNMGVASLLPRDLVSGNTERNTQPMRCSSAKTIIF